jgi:hypothetical protein
VPSLAHHLRHFIYIDRRGQSSVRLADLCAQCWPVSVGSIFADEVDGEPYRQVYVVLPNRKGDDFVAHLITLTPVQEMLLAEM